MEFHEAIIIAILLFVFGLIIIAALYKDHEACKPEDVSNAHSKSNHQWTSEYYEGSAPVRKPRRHKARYTRTYQKWEKVKDKMHDVDVEKLASESGLSTSTIFRILKLYRLGTPDEVNDFETSKRTVWAIAKDIERRYE